MHAAPELRTLAKDFRRRLTLPEGLLWRALKGGRYGRLHVRRQHPVGPYLLDFFCASSQLCIEVDGGSHSFGDRPERDERRDAWLAERGIRTLRINAQVVLKDIDSAVAMVVAAARA
ncbi:endonuclease domain-containing protein [Phenylobacterium sp.]|uniref:endonuclease domain-containing protein n=1 Tax=Phenylobacterium sp. TaxID=1871053 RepID=UPI002716CB6D|nr:endonuclease domain-containing protein [Phenylobacterium sp.]MDO8798978.1 endonuclease domain-containing protein [Phenylobacterium sp.]